MADRVGPPPATVALPAIFLMVFMSCCGCSTFHPDLQELVNVVSFPANLGSPQLGPLSLRMRCPLTGTSGGRKAVWPAPFTDLVIFCSFTCKSCVHAFSVPPQFLLAMFSTIVVSFSTASWLVSRPLATFLAALRQVPTCFIPCRRPQSSCCPPSTLEAGRIFRSCAFWIVPRFLLHPFAVVGLGVSLLALPLSHFACSRSSAASLRIRIALVTSLSTNAS